MAMLPIHITSLRFGLLAVGEIHRDLRLVVIRGLRRTCVRTIDDAIELRFVTSELIEPDKTQASADYPVGQRILVQSGAPVSVVRNRS